MHPVIQSVLRRSEQGVLRPFLCVGEDGVQYFVKGRGAGRTNLVTEFVAGKLGQKLGLPIPHIEVVRVPEMLIRSSAVAGIGELGAGLAFGSKAVEFAQELGRLHLSRVQADLRLDVLLFDRWINNEDRTFGLAGGNPNLMWDARGEGLVVIDHNLGFDPGFDTVRFWQNHIFRADGAAFGDPGFRAIKTKWLDEALTGLDNIIKELPEEWAFEDSMETVPVDFDIERARMILRQHHTEYFWNVPQ